MTNIVVAWLHPIFDELNGDEKNALAQLQQITNNISFFVDTDRCVDFITELQNQKVFLVVSCDVGQCIVPCIHDVTHIDLIYVFCPQHCNHEQWMGEYRKIKGVFANNNAICESLKKITQHLNQNSLAFNLVTKKEVKTKDLNELNPSFMYTKLLKEVLLEIQFNGEVVKQLIDYWRDQFANNHSTLRRINKFEQEYRQHQPTWWYTYESLLYETLNRALRTMNTDIIVRMGFFLKDLHCDIEQLHSQQMARLFHQTFTVYRGQGVSKDDFEQLSKTKGGLLSFNNFLSTTLDHDISFFRAESNLENPDLVGIHFKIHVHPSSASIPFAHLDNVSYYNDQESEILFSMHAIFRIDHIESVDDAKRLWRVGLTLTEDNDELLQTLTQRIRNEMSESGQGWFRLGALFIKLGHFDKAEQLYTSLMKHAMGSEKGALFNAMGIVQNKLGNYEEALSFYNKALGIARTVYPANHYSLADLYNNMGLAYTSIGQYSEALSVHQSSLKIRENLIPEEALDIAASCANIGSLLQETGEYVKALSYHQRAADIFEKVLPTYHPDLATAYNNIGVVLLNMGEYSKALRTHEKALDIRLRVLPMNHPAFAESYRNMALVLEDMRQYEKAISFNIKGIEILRQTSTPYHPDLAGFYNNLAVIYQEIGDYTKALSFHTDALEICQKTLPSNHSSIATSYHNMGMVCFNLGKYSEALSLYEKALRIFRQTYAEDHPCYGTLYKNIYMVCLHLDDLSRALEMLRLLLPSDHTDLKQVEYLISLGGGLL